MPVPRRANWVPLVMSFPKLFNVGTSPNARRFSKHSRSATRIARSPSNCFGRGQPIVWTPDRESWKPLWPTMVQMTPASVDRHWNGPPPVADP